MGLEENKKHNVQLTDLVRKRFLKEIISNYLRTAISFYEYMKRASDSKTKRLCTKTITKLQQAIVSVNEIKHIEILDYYYTLCIAPYYQVYVVVGSLASSKQMKDYDTEEGIIAFREKMEDFKNKSIEKEKQNQESANAIKKAKEEGKKVEMVWDKDTKTVKPVIVEEKSNA